MTTRSKRLRVSVPLTKELDAKLERISEKLSVSKSSLCAMLISQGAVQKEVELELMSTPNLNRIMQEQIDKNKGK